MNFKNVLKACRIFLGMNGEKSKYKITSDTLVPKFGETPALPPTEVKAVEISQRNWFWWPLFSLSNPFSRKAKTAKRLVQAELRLGKVEPMRNDLSDSDLMVVTKPKDDLVKKRMWLAQSLLEHDRKDFYRGEEKGKESMDLQRSELMAPRQNIQSIARK